MRNRRLLFWGIQQTLLFPLLLLAGVMLPIENGPGWLQTMSQFNPLTYVVNAERALFNGVFDMSVVGAGAAAAAVVAGVGLTVGVWAMRTG